MQYGQISLREWFQIVFVKMIKREEEGNGSLLFFKEISMPNWCYNSLVAYGDENDIAEFIDYFASENGGFTFSRIMPMPSQFEYAAEGEGSQDTAGALHWCREHWGTKWDACDVNMNVYTFDSFSIVNIWFETASNPPFPVLDKIAQQWSKLEFLFRAQMEPAAEEVPYIAQYQAGQGFSDVLIEKWMAVTLFDPASQSSDIDIEAAAEVSPLFLEQWERDDRIKKAMMLFGYGTEEREALVIANANPRCEAFVG